MKKLFKTLVPATLTLLSLTRLHAEEIPAVKSSIVFSGIAFELRSKPGTEALSGSLRRLTADYGFVADLSFPPSLIESSRQFDIDVDTQSPTETYVTIGYLPAGSAEAFTRDAAVRHIKGGKTPLACDTLPSLLTVISQHLGLFKVNGVALLGVSRSCPQGAPCRARVIVRSDGQAASSQVRAEMLKQVPELSTWDLLIHAPSAATTLNSRL